MNGVKAPLSIIWIELVFEAWLQAAAKRHVDPYTIWTLQTQFRQFGFGNKVPDFLDFLVELDQPMGDGEPLWPAGIDVPPVYREAVPGAAGTARHITVRLAVPADGPQAVANTVASLMFLSGVRRAQIGFPRPNIPPGPKGNVPPRHERRDRSDPAQTVLLGVLEDGCPFGHPALATRHGTRVVALWDQTMVAPDSHDPAPAAFGYGRERTQGQLDALMKRHLEPDGVDEEFLYADPAALQRRIPIRGSHAAAVITVLAGRSGALPSRPRAASGSVPDQPAATAPLAVVQFPREQINVAGARWLVVRALDGLRYLAGQSAKLARAGGPPLPLVVNLSYGSMVGAHDGTALFETAMAEVCQLHGQMAIVLAAGNAHGTARAKDTTDDLARAPSGRHAELTLEPGSTSALTLYVPPNKPIETYLEIWFEDVHADPLGEQFLERNDVQIHVTTPLGKLLRVDKVPDLAFEFAEDGQAQAGLICLPRVAQSCCRSLALLVIAATQISTTRVEVPSGAWTVRVINTSKTRTLHVQAWVERDLVPGARHSQAARLLDTTAPQTPLSDRNTLNNIATGPGTFRVGALTARGAQQRQRVSPYSSAAAEPAAGPEFSAVADRSPAQPGVRVSGNCSGSVIRMNGTSVAAPQAARWLANRLADGANLAQIREELMDAEQGDAREGRIWV
jgi:hypothetical protein